MVQQEYHCFVSGLPEISLDGSALWTTPSKFVEALGLELHPDDFGMARLLLLRYDHENLVRFLLGKDLIHIGVAHFGADDFTRQTEIFESITPEEDILPPYMSDVLRLYRGEEEPINHVECRRKLDDGYFFWVMEKGSRFIREYIDFEYNLSNMLTYIVNSNAGSGQPDEGIAGNGQFARHLHETAGKNLVKDHEFEYFDDILTIADSFMLAGAEMKYDLLRWDVIEKLTLFEDFTADAVLAYLQKLLIASRWERLTEQAGREKLIETIDNAIGTTLLHEEA
jgi:hypothetical protein